MFRLVTASLLQPRARLAAGGVLMAMVVLGLSGATAGAHGPCRCLPRTVHPGDTVVVGNVFRAVWNPTRADIYYGQPALVAAHVEGTPRLVVLSRDRKDARKRARFLVPDVPADRYLVLLYDGSEGGAHYTWDSMTVRQRPVKSPSAATAANRRESTRGRRGFPTVAVVVGALLLTAVGLLSTLRRRRAGQ